MFSSILIVLSTQLHVGGNSVCAWGQRYIVVFDINKQTLTSFLTIPTGSMLNEIVIFWQICQHVCLLSLLQV
jgi:hypothetical protein